MKQETQVVLLQIGKYNLISDVFVAVVDHTSVFTDQTVVHEIWESLQSFINKGKNNHFT